MDWNERKSLDSQEKTVGLEVIEAAEMRGSKVILRHPIVVTEVENGYLMEVKPGERYVWNSAAQLVTNFAEYLQNPEAFQKKAEAH